LVHFFQRRTSLHHIHAMPNQSTRSTYTALVTCETQTSANHPGQLSLAIPTW